MGRKLMRVPMDFSWPLNKTWGGYLNPYSWQSADCPACAGSGDSPRAKLFRDQWYGNAPFDPVEYGATPLTIDHPDLQAFARRNVANAPDFYGTGERAIQREALRLFNLWRCQWSHNLIQADVDALVAADRLWDFTRRPRNEEQSEKLRASEKHWLPESNGYVPTAVEVNAWSLRPFGHDAINSWTCVEARCKREGVPYRCDRCNGDGCLWPTPEIAKLHEEWTAAEPPTGEGFQLWETTSEGSPISDVFASLDELCAWCERNATTFGSSKTNAAEWKRMLEEDFVCHKEGNVVFL